MNGEASVYYISYPEGRGVVLRVLHIALLANNPKITNMECLLFVSSGHINTVVNICNIFIAKVSFYLLVFPNRVAGLTLLIMINYTDYTKKSERNFFVLNMMLEFSIWYLISLS